MKKLMMVIALVASAVSAKAACVDWAVAATASDVNSTVYLLSAVGDFASADDLVAAAISSSTVASAGRGKYATPKKTANSSSITKDGEYFYAILAADKSSFSYVTATGLADSVYDPDLQESSLGTYDKVNFAAIKNGTTQSFGAVPEPTSGLLLLLGMAGLALRRKQK